LLIVVYDKIGENINLDIDVTSGRGPETITIDDVHKLEPGRHQLLVHHYSGESSFPESGAKISAFDSLDQVDMFKHAKDGIKKAGQSLDSDQASSTLKSMGYKYGDGCQYVTTQNVKGDFKVWNCFEFEYAPTKQLLDCILESVPAVSICRLCAAC
jgi:hypothetical protein